MSSRQQATAAQDSAAAAVKQADAAAEQVHAAREQVTLGHRQLELAEKIRKEQSEPYVVVDVQPSTFAGGFLNLVIENIGTTVARDVQFLFDPPLRSSLEQKHNYSPGDARILTDGISMLPPGRRIEFLFDFSPDRNEQGLHSVHQVTVRANGPGGTVEPMHYVIDTAALSGPRFLVEKTVHSGVKTLEKMQKDLQRIQADLHAVARRLGPSDEGQTPQE